MRHFRKHLRFLLLVLLPCFVILAGAEIAFRLNRTYSWWTPPARATLYPPRSLDLPYTNRLSEKIDLSFLEKNPDFYASQRALSGQTIDQALRSPSPSSLAILTPSGAVLYEVNYHYDSLGRRATTPDRQEAAKFIALFGDSWTFGEGVDDAYTTASQLAHKIKNARVLNFGVAGAGMNDLYKQVMAPDFPGFRDLAGKEGVLVYYFSNSSLSLVTCPLSCLRQSWIADKPLYQLKEGKITAMGTFRQNRPWLNSWYWLLGHSAFLRFFSLDIPPRPLPGDYDLFLSLYRGMADKLRETANVSHVVLAIAPSTESAIAGEIAVRAADFGVEVWDYSPVSMELLTADRAYIPYDLHPSPEYYWVLSELFRLNLRTLGVD